MVGNALKQAANGATAQKAATSNAERRVSFPGRFQKPSPVPGSDRSILAEGACKKRLRSIDTVPVLTDAAAGTNCRARLAGKSSKKLLNIDPCQQQPPSAYARAVSSSKSSRTLALLPDTGSRNGTTPAATEPGPMQRQSSTSCSTHRAMLKGRSSRKLLAAAVADDIGSEQSSPATPGANSAAAESRARLAGRSSKRLMSVGATDTEADPEVAGSLGFSQHSTPTGFRAMLAGKSSCKLLLTSAVDSDSETVTPAQKPWQMFDPSGGASSSRAKLSGKSSRKLMFAMARDSNMHSSSVGTPAQQPSQLFDLSTATSASRSMLSGKSSRKLLLSASSTPFDSENSTPRTSDCGSATAGARGMLAGRSSRKLLHVLDSTAGPEAASPLASRSASRSAMLSGRSSRKLLQILGSAADPQAATPGATRSATRSAMLSGRSSRKLLSPPCGGVTGLDSPEAATPAADIPNLGGPARHSAVLSGRSSRKLLSQTSSAQQQGLFEAHTPQPGAADSLASGRSSQLSSSRALLAGMSSRRLLGLAALAQPQVSDSEQLSESDPGDGPLADAVVHITFTDSNTSKASDLIKTSHTAPPDAAAVCTAGTREQRARVDSLAVLLSNAAEKDVLLDAVAELQGLAAGSLAVRLVIGHNAKIVQGLSDLLDDSDLDLQCAAVALTCDLVSGVPDNQLPVGNNLGLVDGLVQLLHNSNKAVQANAAVALWALAADNPTVPGKVGWRGGHKMVEYVARMLEDPATSGFAAALVWALVSGHSNNQALFAGVRSSSLASMGSGVIGQLLMLIQEGTDSEQEYAAGALQCLLAGHEHVIKLAKVLGVGETVRGLIAGVSSDEAAANLRAVLEVVPRHPVGV